MIADPDWAIDLLTKYKTERNIILEAEQKRDTLFIENTNLKTDIGLSKDYASVKMVEKITKRRFDWAPLRRYSKHHELEIKESFDQNYGKVNAYSKEAWYACYNISLVSLLDDK